MSTTRASRIFDGHFNRRNVVVMGAARGIGLVIAESFARAGAQVRIVDRSNDVAVAADKLVAEGLTVTWAVADVTEDHQVRQLFTDVARDWGTLDVLVNNAGVISIKPLDQTPTEDFERVLAINTTGMFVAAREAYPLLKAAGGGSIINAASGQARQGFIYTPSYAASKFGVIGLTQSLAKELAKDNIRVNAYCPGIVATEMWAYNDREWGKLLGDYAPGELMAKWISEIPMGRAALDVDVANTVLFLASEAGNYITGQAINVDGGMFMN